MAQKTQRERINQKNADRNWRPLTIPVRRFFLGELRQARLAAQMDSEAFDKLLFVLERLGSYCLAEVGTLGDYEKCLCDLATESSFGQPLKKTQTPWHSEVAVLYRLVMSARNDALHEWHVFLLEALGWN